MDRNSWRATKKQIRFVHLFVLALLACLASLTGLHQKTIPGEPSLVSHQPTIDASGGSSQSKELHRLVEEEEEISSETERHLLGPSLGLAPTLSASRSTPPKAFLLPGEAFIVSSAMPRGPPAFRL